MNAIEIAASVRAGEVSAREVVEGYLATIDAGNGELNALLLVGEQAARAAADEVDAVVAAGNENSNACDTSPASAPQAITVAASRLGLLLTD